MEFPTTDGPGPQQTQNGQVCNLAGGARVATHGIAALLRVLLSLLLTLQPALPLTRASAVALTLALMRTH